MVIEIYSKEKCSACVEAKIVLNTLGIGFTEKVIGEDITLEAVLAKFPEAKTVPIVLLDGEWIGGRDELFKRLNVLH